MTFFGEPQWAVVGDTFPVGCKPQVSLDRDYKYHIVFVSYINRMKTIEPSHFFIPTKLSYSMDIRKQGN